MKTIDEKLVKLKLKQLIYYMINMQQMKFSEIILVVRFDELKNFLTNLIKNSNFSIFYFISMSIRQQANNLSLKVLEKTCHFGTHTTRNCDSVTFFSKRTVTMIAFLEVYFFRVKFQHNLKTFKLGIIRQNFIGSRSNSFRLVSCCSYSCKKNQNYSKIYVHQHYKIAQVYVFIQYQNILQRYLMHKSFLIPPSINRILGKNRNSVNLIQQSANMTLRKQNCSPISKDAASEYTFEPKINSSNSKRRTLQKFIEDQQRFQQEKQRKINQLKEEISKWEDEQMRPSPHINTFYRQKTNSFMNNQSVFERLSKDRPSKHSITQTDSFSPNILPRSKQICREKTVSDLLYQDALRRQSKQKIVKLSEQKKLLAMCAPKINKNTNQLVRKKIFNQFIYLTNDSSMNPLVALSVLEEIFNVKLRDTSNELVRRIIELIANEKMEVSTEKLWSFIDLIIGTGFDSCFQKEVQEQIQQKYHFFYQQRIKKQKKKTQQEQQPTFKPKTLEASEELAEKHRTKQCKKISEFIEKEKIHVNIENETISLEDLFIISQMKKEKENQQKRKDKENAQLAQCTFKPRISPMKPAAKTKQKIVLRQPLKQKTTNQNIKDNEKIGLKSKKSYSKVNSIEKTERSFINPGKKQNILNRNRKSVDSLSVRLFLGRTERQFQQNMTMRGYPEGENWTENNRLKHREIVQNSEKIKGLKNQS